MQKPFPSGTRPPGTRPPGTRPPGTRPPGTRPLSPPVRPSRRPPSGPPGVKSGKMSAADLSSWLSGPGSSVLGETQGPPGTYKTPFQDPNAMRHWTSQQRKFGRSSPTRVSMADPQDMDYWSNLGYSGGGEVKAKKTGYVKKYAKGGGTRKVKT